MKIFTSFIIFGVFAGCINQHDEKNFVTDKNQEIVGVAAEDTLKEKALEYLDILPKLRILKITSNDSLQFSFSIRSDSLQNLKNLSMDMEACCEITFMGSVERGVHYSMTGLTPPIKADTITLLQWTKEMLTRCNKYKSEFRGWGATVSKIKYYEGHE